MTVDIDDAIAIAEHEWRLSKVDARDLAALSRDLRLDLEAAAADGVTPQQLIGDFRSFARRVAEEADARRVPYEYQRLLLTALAGRRAGRAGRDRAAPGARGRPRRSGVLRRPARPGGQRVLRRLSDPTGVRPSR
jgi:hypothetical protein